MTFHQKPQLGIQLNHKHPLAKGLINCWIMNETTGDIVFDRGSLYNHGANLGANWIPKGLNFAGAERVELPILSIEDRATFTISTRFNGAAGGIMYGEGFNGDTQWTILLQIDDGAPFSGRYYVKDNNVWKALTAGTTTVNDGWHTVSISQKSKSFRTIYIDGIPEGTNNDVIGDMSTLNTANIGVLERTALAAYFVGDIAYMHIHDFAFTDADADLYNRDPHGMFKRSMLPPSMYYISPGNPYWYYQMLRRRN